MATHSSILAWKIPWTEVLGGSVSMRLPRAGHNWETQHTLCVLIMSGIIHNFITFEFGVHFNIEFTRYLLSDVVSCN